MRKNIIVRMGTPRFLRKGDEVTIPVIVHNYLDQAKQVQLSLDIDGLDPVSWRTAVRLPSPARARAPRCGACKASQIGTATLLAKALTNEESDALEITFPVEPNGVPRTINGVGRDRRTYSADTQRSTFRPTLMRLRTLCILRLVLRLPGSMFSALDYLTTYPYGCTEQTMSSFLPNVVVAETLKKLNLSGRSTRPTCRRRFTPALIALHDLKHDDGGWGWWKEDDSRVFMTAYVVVRTGGGQALQAMPRRRRKSRRGSGYLQKQLAQHPRMIPDLRAYVVYALSEAGCEESGSIARNSVVAAQRPLSRRARADRPGDAALRGQPRGADCANLEGKAKRAGTLASWPSGYNPLLDLDYDNSAESTAFALRFLTHADPQSPLLEARGAVAGGESQRRLLVELDRADSDGALWPGRLSRGLAGAERGLRCGRVAQRQLDRQTAFHRCRCGLRSRLAGRCDCRPIACRQANTVQIMKHGNGRAYWSVQGKYYSTEQKLYQQGTLSLNLTRDYYKLTPNTKDGQIVYRLDPLKGPVLPGDTLAVHLAVNGSPAKYLLIEDPIPAGTEFVQHEDSYKILDQPATWQYWYTRSEFHDDRAAFFATESNGRHESFYLLKVVNPGSFSISPAHVQPMYQPGVQATSDLLHLQVDAAPSAAEEKK